uniref:ATP synthase complex subunit 8 n=2 Tax=Melanotaenia TaxID=32459 RepID=K7XAX1_9TELE|nr:ATP synthase F0 subunit 8 [Melanotaenia angfa]AFX67993.1 ATP synthase F0 subunit 8 [Melanotaenia parva]
MPQLKLEPWFLILVLAWLIFMTLAPRKVIEYSYPNRLSSKDTKAPKSLPWTWLWH